MADFYVGQKVVCVSEAWTLIAGKNPPCWPGLNRIYVITRMMMRHPGVAVEVAASLAPFLVFPEMPDWGWAHQGFRPLEDVHVEMFRRMVEPAALTKVKALEEVKHGD
jgi:hypothetical protein